jgi:hypothetical protein
MIWQLRKKRKKVLVNSILYKWISQILEGNDKDLLQLTSIFQFAFVINICLFYEVNMINEKWNDESIRQTTNINIFEIGFILNLYSATTNK